MKVKILHDERHALTKVQQSTKEATQGLVTHLKPQTSHDINTRFLI